MQAIAGDQDWERQKERVRRTLAPIVSYSLTESKVTVARSDRALCCLVPDQSLLLLFIHSLSLSVDVYHVVKSESECVSTMYALYSAGAMN